MYAAEMYASAADLLTKGYLEKDDCGASLLRGAAISRKIKDSRRVSDRCLDYAAPI